MSKLIVIYIVFWLCSIVLSRHLSEFELLDEEEHELVRAATYDQDDFDDEFELQPGKIDLVKDTIWMMKAKIKEVKALNKALASKLLASKLKLKEMLLDKLDSKKNHIYRKLDTKKDLINDKLDSKNHPHEQHPTNNPSKYYYQASSYPQHGQKHQGQQFGVPQYVTPQYDASQHGQEYYASYDPYYGH